MSRRTLNGNIICKNIEETKKQSASGFETIKEDKWKSLKVITSSEDDILEGYVVLVSVNSGEEREEDGEINVIINRRDIIYYDED